MSTLPAHAGAIAMIAALIAVVGSSGLTSAKDPTTITLNPGQAVMVANIVDGDTFKGHDGQPYRLHGIDAPEICQPWGPRARLELAHVLAEGDVRTWRAGRSWQREVVDVIVLRADGLSLDAAAELLRLGVAMVDDRYVSGLRERALLAIEQNARESGVGMWAYRPESPRDWRAEHRLVRPPGCVQRKTHADR